MDEVLPQQLTALHVLEKASEDVLVPLRMLQGFDATAFQILLAAVDQCTAAYAHADGLPKEVAALFFDMYPAMVSASYLYNDQVNGQIQQEAERLADHIRSCFYTHPS